MILMSAPMYSFYAPPKNLNSKKTVEKGKISVFSFGRGIVVVM